MSLSRPDVWVTMSSSSTTTSSSSSLQLSKTKLELLTKTVIFEREILTYRVAARLFRCSVQDAKA